MNAVPKTAGAAAVPLPAAPQAPVAGQAPAVQQEMLRFLVCGSVDDGKSTLIGRLLYDSRLLYDDQIEAVTRDSARYGTTGGGFDPALVTDGLKAEREQGITIDVAYRYFSTARRKFIIVDAPGHEQYTRNMATGASNCDLAVLLIDARRGLLTQTRRHSFIASLLGIQHVIVAVNKMDLVGYREEVFEALHRDYTALAARLELKDVRFIPISALHGDNVVEPSRAMPWYRGGTLMHMLDNAHVASDRNLIDLRLPIQFAHRPHAGFRGYCGTIASGVVRRGDEVVILPADRRSRIERIVTFAGEPEEAFAPQAVTVILADDVDVSRGDMLVRPANMPRIDDHLEAMIVWMHEAPLEPGRRYVIKHTTRSVLGAVSAVRYRINVNTLHRERADALAQNEIGRCAVRLNQAIPWDAYARNRATGAFIMIDRMSNATVAAGMILDRAAESTEQQRWLARPVAWHQVPTPDSSTTVKSTDDPASTAEVTTRSVPVPRPTPATILLTGLVGAGKTTIARALERRLAALGQPCVALIGRELRGGLSRDLGFSAHDRSENLRRGVEVARLLNGSGMTCICAFVAPQEQTRRLARDRIGSGRFFHIHLDAPLDVCRARDRSGLYEAADTGDAAEVPGVSFLYDPPVTADLRLDTARRTIEACVEKIVAMLRERGVITAGESAADRSKGE